MSVSITSTMNKCINFGTSQCNPTPIQYNKNVTSFNNPSISKSVRLSEYISTNRYKKVIQNQKLKDMYLGLDKQLLINLVKGFG